MTKEELLEKIKIRREAVGITIDNLSKVSNLGFRTITRFFAWDDIRLSSLEKLTQVVGLDFAGNEIVDIPTLKDKRAEQKALDVISMTKNISSLKDNEYQKLLQETKQKFLTGEYKSLLWVV